MPSETDNNLKIYSFFSFRYSVMISEDSLFMMLFEWSECSDGWGAFDPSFTSSLFFFTIFYEIFSWTFETYSPSDRSYFRL